MEISKILIANRGEIAVRIIRAARKLGLNTLAVYSDLDGPEAYHCRMADLSLPLHGTELADTYLNIEKMTGLARENGTRAIHPGYGFLSEDPVFAEACEKNGLVFIGPPPELIRLMGNKIQARARVASFGIPVTGAEISDPEEMIAMAPDLKYPLLIKAAAGGGGKGMRIVKRKEDLAGALEATRHEAGNYFGNGEVFLEQYIDPARHIEFQVLGDHHGNAVHFYERECSVQRRFQKIMEESPSAWLEPETRKAMAEAALKICRELGYTGAGTIEFLVDRGQKFYFLEMNTRIQVEHPVTEMVSGADLVREQIRIAQGLPLSFTQEDIRIRGHAIEARIYAEDPLRQFMPSPGRVSHYREPSDPGIRVDSSIDGPADIHARYDPMIAKIIVRGQDRTEALHHLSTGLSETSILGVETNLNFLQEIVRDKKFISNELSVQYCDLRQDLLVRRIRKRREGGDRLLQIAGFLAGTLLSGQDAREVNDRTGTRQVPDPSDPRNAADPVVPGNAVPRTDPWHATGYWRLSSLFRFSLDGADMDAHIEPAGSDGLKCRFRGISLEISSVRFENGELRFLLNGEPRKLFYGELPNGDEIVDHQGIRAIFRRWDSLPSVPAATETSGGAESNGSRVTSPMYGKVVKIHVKEKGTVKRGDIMLTIDSMKIENNILAPRKARVVKILVEPGMQVEVNRTLLTIE